MTTPRDRIARVLAGSMFSGDGSLSYISPKDAAQADAVLAAPLTPDGATIPELIWLWNDVREGRWEGAAPAYPNLLEMVRDCIEDEAEAVRAASNTLPEKDDREADENDDEHPVDHAAEPTP